jgi:hypothetical protein
LNFELMTRPWQVPFFLVSCVSGLVGCATPVKQGHRLDAWQDGGLIFGDGGRSDAGMDDLDLDRDRGAVLDAAADVAAVDAAADGPGADTIPAPKTLERTLSYAGIGNSVWLHVVRRDAGAAAVTVRTVRRNNDLTPPFASGLTPQIADGKCQSTKFSGTVADGTAFTTTIKSCLAGHKLTISHSSVIGTNPPNPAQVHGTVSMNPADTTLPYERSLHFIGSGGGEWLHVARVPVGSTLVDTRTVEYNGAVDPPIRDFQVSSIAAGACKAHTYSGTFVSDGAPFSVKVDFCRSGSLLSIQHAATSGGVTNPPQAHGSIPIE